MVARVGGRRPAVATKTHGAEYWGGLHFPADFTRRGEEHLHKFGYLAPPPHRNALSRGLREYGLRGGAARKQLPSLDSIRPQNATGMEEQKRAWQDSFRFNGLVRLMEDGEKSLNSPPTTPPPLPPHRLL